MRTSPTLLRWMLTAAWLTSAAVQAQPVWRPLVGLGVTVGGDKLVGNIRLSNGETEDVQAGQYLQFLGGVEYQAVPRFSVQASAGYHVDNSPRASNGSARFARYPLELLGHVELDDNVRVGGGLRWLYAVPCGT